MASILDSRDVTRLVVMAKDSIECFCAAMSRFTLSSRAELLSVSESLSGAEAGSKSVFAGGLSGEGDPPENCWSSSSTAASISRSMSAERFG